MLKAGGVKKHKNKQVEGVYYCCIHSRDSTNLGAVQCCAVQCTLGETAATEPPSYHIISHHITDITDITDITTSKAVSVQVLLLL